MLDRFTETAKAIVSEAREIAETLNHSEIDNEHLIKAICQNKNCFAQKIIIMSNTPGEIIDRELESVLQPHDKSSPRKIGFNKHVKKTIEKAFRHTEAEKFTWIHSGLILLGIYESGSELSKQLLENWNLSKETILEAIKRTGDLSGSVEKVEPPPQMDQYLYDLSHCFTKDAKQVISHAIQLANTYNNPIVNFHHLFLSFTFLSVRKVIDVEPIKASMLDLDQVKKYVTNQMAPEERQDIDHILFSKDVSEILRVAVIEAFQQQKDEVGVSHLALGLLAMHPNEIRDNSKLNYLKLRQLILEDLLKPDQQLTTKTFPVRSLGLKHPQISLRRYNADAGAVITIPKKHAVEWQVMALNINDNLLTVAMCNPDDEEVIQKIKELSGMELSIIKADKQDLLAAFKMYY